MQEYFDAQDWYNGYIEPEDFVESEELSELEQGNALYRLPHLPGQYLERGNTRPLYSAYKLAKMAALTRW